MNEEKAGDENISLEGLSLKLYLYLIEQDRPSSIRDIARGIGAGHSSVHYHIKRLVEAGIVERRSDGYVVARRISLEGFIYLGRHLYPRMLIYGLFFIGVLIGEIIASILMRRVTYDKILVIATSLTASILFIYEGTEARRRILHGRR